MNCKLCAVMGEPESLSKIKLFSDAICTAVISKRPASLCHVVLFPNKHYTILEQVPDTEVAHMMDIANVISMSMFDSLNIQGTNIYVENGIAAGQQEPHFLINIIARVEKDGVKLTWEPQKGNEEELSISLAGYKQELGGISISAQSGAPKAEEKKEDKKKEALAENNYLVKYYRPRA